MIGLTSGTFRLATFKHALRIQFPRRFVNLDPECISNAIERPVQNDKSIDLVRAEPNIRQLAGNCRGGGFAAASRILFARPNFLSSMSCASILNGGNVPPL